MTNEDPGATPGVFVSQPQAAGSIARQPSASIASKRSHVSTAPEIMPDSRAPSISSADPKCDVEVTFVLPPRSSNVKRLGAALVAETRDIEQERPGETLGRLDLQVLAVEDDVLAIGGAAPVAPRPADPDVHLDDGRRGPVGPPPARDALGIHERCPDDVARGIEGALEDELAPSE